MRLSQKVLSIFTLTSLIFSGQCAPKKEKNDEADALGMSASYKRKPEAFREIWRTLGFYANISHHIYFVGADAGVGNRQCWYEAISGLFERRRQPDFLAAESKSLTGGFLSLPRAIELVEAKKNSLKNSPNSDAAIQIRRCFGSVENGNLQLKRT